MTQLYGDRMYLANATGCTQAWGAAAPCVPYTTNKEGWGPAWSNSLFENNAQFSVGMVLAVEQQRDRVTMKVKDLLALTAGTDFAAAAETWLENWDNGDRSKADSRAVIAALKELQVDGAAAELRTSFWKTRTPDKENPCGCTAVTAGHTTSATAVWTRSGKRP